MEIIKSQPAKENSGYQSIKQTNEDESLKSVAVATKYQEIKHKVRMYAFMYTCTHTYVWMLSWTTVVVHNRDRPGNL